MKKNLTYLILTLLLIFVIFFSLLQGSVSIESGSVITMLGNWLTGTQPENANLYNLLMEIRFPRIILTVIAGAVLSSVGVLMQTITRNPLAEPYVLGVSSGASAGAVGAIVFHWLAFLRGANIFLCAFLGSFLATCIVLALQGKSTSPVRLVLTGMGVSSFFQAVTTLIVYSAKNEAQARSAMFWITGSFSGANWEDVKIAAVTLLVLMVFCFLMDKELNLLLLGQSAAQQTGLNVRRVRLVVILFSSFAVAVIVAQSGIIGFVGLIIPHIMRIIIGSRQRPLLICSALGGGIFLAAADTAARTIFSPQEVPIGIMTSFVGAPVFIAMIYRSYHDE